MQTKNTLAVQRVPIITSTTVVFSVYEITENFPYDHSTVTSFSERDIEGWWGRLGTRRLPKAINDIPVGEERFAAVKTFQRFQHEEAYRAIVTAYPELESNQDARFEHGEVSLSTNHRNGAGDSSDIEFIDRRELVG